MSRSTFPFAIPFDDVAAGVANDVSFLSEGKPAGDNGRIIVRGGRFIEEGTGRRIRFFGTNLGATQAYPEPADARLIARRLAKAGVNVVRLHHLDNCWLINRGGSIWDRNRPDRQQFDPAQIEKLDGLVAQLKSQGIYVNINLKVSKELTPADGMPESITKVPYPHQKRIDFFQRRMIDLQKDYARKLLTHVNPHTGMAYTDDPAVAFVEINNENALLGFWTRNIGAGLEKLPEPFLGELIDLWNRWLRARGKPGNERAVPLGADDARWTEYIAFLADTEEAYADEMLGFLRSDLKVRGNICLSQIDYGGILGMRRERRMDFTDAHAYWQHPHFPGGAWDAQNWTIENTPQVAAMGEQGFGALGGLALTRIVGKPYAVSEYDHPAPSDYACEMLPTFAAFAAVQDWDALYTFAANDYGQVRKPDHILGYFDQNNHPAKWAFYAAAALVFRQGLISPAAASARLELPQPLNSTSYHFDEAWRKVLGSLAPGFLTRRLGVSETPLASGAAPRVSLEGIAAAPDAARIDTTAAGQVFVAAGSSAAIVAGYIGGATIVAGDLTITTAAFGNNFASVAAVATDGRPLAESRRILVTVCGRVENQQMTWNQARTTIGTGWGHGPTLAEHVPATLTVEGAAKRSVYRLDARGQRSGQVSAQTTVGGLTFAVSPADQTLWYEIAAT
jgi:hypothetical protein